MNITKLSSSTLFKFIKAHFPAFSEEFEDMVVDKHLTGRLIFELSAASAIKMFGGRLGEYEQLVESLKANYSWDDDSDVENGFGGATSRQVFTNLTDVYANSTNSMSRSTFALFGSNNYPDLTLGGIPKAFGGFANGINTDFATSQSTIAIADNIVITLPKHIEEVSSDVLELLVFPADQLNSVTRSVLADPKLNPTEKHRQEVAEILFSSMISVVGLYPHKDHYKDAVRSVLRAYPHLNTLIVHRLTRKTFKQKLHLSLRERYAHHRKTDLGAKESAERIEAQKKHTPKVKRKSSKGHLASAQTPKKQ